MSGSFDNYKNIIKNNQMKRTYELSDIRFRERAGYKDMFLGPMSSNFNNSNDVNKLIDLTSRGIHSGTEYSFVANSLLRPSIGTKSAKASIANGWGESRAMFLMTIRQSLDGLNNTTSYLSHLFVGFTDHFDVSLQSQHLPDDMKLTLNHVFTFRETPTANCFGSTSVQSTLISSHQLFAKQYAAENTFRNPSKVFGVRPGDIFSNIQTSGMMNGFHPSTVRGGINFDDRFILASSTSDSVKFSDRCTNNNASSYLDKTVRAIEAGINYNSMDEDHWPSEDEVTNASYIYASSNDSSIGTNNPAMEFLLDISGSLDYAHRGYITFRELRSFFGDRVDNILNKPGNVSIIPSSQVNSTKSIINSLQGFSAKTKQTEIAIMLGHSIPTYMMRCGIVEYGFISSNDSRSSFAGTTGFDTKPIVSDSGLGSVMLKLFCNSFDTAKQMRLFHEMIERELLLSVSHNNAQKLVVKVTCSLCGDTTIDVIWGNEPQEQFIIPTFCDNLFGPMTTINSDDLNLLSEDILSLSMQLGGNTVDDMPSHKDVTGFGDINNLSSLIDRTPFQTAIRNQNSNFTNTGATDAKFELY